MGYCNAFVLLAHAGLGQQPQTAVTLLTPLTCAVPASQRLASVLELMAALAPPAVLVGDPAAFQVEG